VVTLTTLAEDYFAEVEAPTKGLALIPDAGHSPPSPNPTGSWPNCAPTSAHGQPRPQPRPPGSHDDADPWSA
jgi:hypothetical protein